MKNMENLKKLKEKKKEESSRHSPQNILVMTVLSSCGCLWCVFRVRLLFGLKYDQKCDKPSTAMSGSKEGREGEKEGWCVWHSRLTSESVFSRRRMKSRKFSVGCQNKQNLFTTKKLQKKPRKRKRERNILECWDAWGEKRKLPNKK